VLHGTAGPVSGVNDFLTRLTEKSTWIRVGEVVLGLILIAVGLARITHAVPVATKIAKTVGAAGVMA
jgi:Na+/phosphate symporter